MAAGPPPEPACGPTAPDPAPRPLGASLEASLDAPMAGWPCANGPGVALPPAAPRRAALRYGLACGGAVALALLAAIALPALPAEDPGWMLAMGSGAAALLLLAGLAWLGATRGPAPLGAALVHASHVHGARLATALAAAHAAAALFMEPVLLADLRPAGPPAMLAGACALALMVWLATTPRHKGRSIHAHPPAAARHALLAAAAIALCALHLLAQDHGGIGWRRGFWAGVLALALATMAWRRIRRRPAAALAPAPQRLGHLAAWTALAALAPIAGALLAYGLLG